MAKSNSMDAYSDRQKSSEDNFMGEINSKLHHLHMNRSDILKKMGMTTDLDLFGSAISLAEDEHVNSHI